MPNLPSSVLSIISLQRVAGQDNTNIAEESNHRTAHHVGCPPEVTLGGFTYIFRSAVLNFRSFFFFFLPPPQFVTTVVLFLSVFPSSRCGKIAGCIVSLLAEVISSSDEVTSGGNGTRCIMRTPPPCKSPAMEVSSTSTDAFLSCQKRLRRC